MCQSASPEHTLVAHPAVVASRRLVALALLAEAPTSTLQQTASEGFSQLPPGAHTMAARRHHIRPPIMPACKPVRQPAESSMHSTHSASSCMMSASRDAGWLASQPALTPASGLAFLHAQAAPDWCPASWGRLEHCWVQTAVEHRPTLRFTSMDPCFSVSGVNPSGTEPASPSTQAR